MAVVPSSSAREGVRAAHGENTRLWWAVVGFLAAMWVLYGLLWPNQDIRNVIVYPVTEACAVAAVVVGVLRYRPSAPAAWLLIAGGFATYLVGDLIWAVYLVQDRSPFPSPADVFYLAGYPVIVAGLAIAVRRRGAAVDARAWLDSGMIAVVAALLVWVYLAQPTIDDPSLSTFEKWVSIAYPVGDLLLLVVAARFVMGSNWRVRSLELLVLGLALTLGGDVLFQLSVADRAGAFFTGDWMLLTGVIFVGIAGLHETMPALTEESSEPLDEGSGTLRIVLLAGVCLAPLAILGIEHARGNSPSIVGIVASVMVVALLAVVRADVVARRALRDARRESALSAYAGELLRSAGDAELFGLAAGTASALLDDGDTAIVRASATEPEASAHTFTVPVVVRGEHVADLVAHASPLTIRRVRTSLATIASELSMALERERLLEAEREASAVLSEQNERLLELDRMKDQFVGTVTHELRTPLTSMIGYLEMLTGESDVGELSAEEQQHFLEIVDRNCQRLNRLVDDILTVARIDSGRFSLERTSVDLVSLASERIESIRAAAEQKEVDIRLTIDQEPPPFYADAMRLGQLLDNLLSNAVKFTPAGSVVRVTLALRGDMVRVEVADSGVGIPKDELDKLFDRFFRASTAAAVQGTGLGLSIAKSIVEAHGGAISVESEIGVGTTFSVDLRVDASQEDPAELGTAEAAR